MTLSKLRDIQRYDVDGQVYLYRLNNTTLQLDGLLFTAKLLRVWNEWQEYKISKILTVANQHVITVNGTTITEGSNPIASTMYYIYVADNNNDWIKTTDYRQKLFLSINAPQSNYYIFLNGSVNNGNAKFLGLVYLNSLTQITDTYSVVSVFNEQTDCHTINGTTDFTYNSTDYTDVTGMNINIVCLSNMQLRFVTTIYASSNNINRNYTPRIQNNGGSFLTYTPTHIPNMGSTSRYVSNTFTNSFDVINNGIYKLQVQIANGDTSTIGYSGIRSTLDVVRIPGVL